MTDTAQKIMELFKRHDKTKAGMVLTFSQLSLNAKDWGQDYFEKLNEAMEELGKEGYAIITPPNGLELTEKGYNYIVNEFL